MRSISWTGMLIISTILFGCSAYPQNMTKQEWNALTLEQQSVALEKQKQTDKYNADNMQCTKKAEKIVRVRITGGSGMWSNGGPNSSTGDMYVHLGEDVNAYSQCMEQAGWKNIKLNSLLEKK